MVPSSLYIQRYKVDSGEGNATVFEEMIGDLSRDELIEGFHGRGWETTHELVH